jgi:hypothetical protein
VGGERRRWRRRGGRPSPEVGRRVERGSDAGCRLEGNSDSRVFSVKERGRLDLIRIFSVLKKLNL